MYRVIVIVLAFMLGVFIFFGADSAVRKSGST